jgi:hypothetical protein
MVQSTVMIPNYQGPLMLAQVSSVQTTDQSTDQSTDKKMRQKLSKESKKEKQDRLKKKTTDDMNDAFSAIADDEETNKDQSADEKKPAQDNSLVLNKERMSSEQKTQTTIEAKVQTKVTLNKWEQEFVDKDDEDDDSSESKKPKNTDVLMVDFSDMNQKDQLMKRQSLVQQNLVSARSTNRKAHESIEDMKNLIFTQKGHSKKQLTIVLNQKLGCEKDLDGYIKEGESYLKQLDSKINALKAMNKGMAEGTLHKDEEKKTDEKKKTEEKPKSLAVSEENSTKDSAATNDAFLKEFTSSDSSDKSDKTAAPAEKVEKPKLLTQVDVDQQLELTNKEWGLKL